MSFVYFFIYDGTCYGWLSCLHKTLRNDPYELLATGAPWNREWSHSVEYMDGFIAVGKMAAALKAHTWIKNREVPHFLKPHGSATVQRSIKRNIWWRQIKRESCVTTAYLLPNICTISLNYTLLFPPVNVRMWSCILNRQWCPKVPQMCLWNVEGIRGKQSCPW